MPTVLTKSAFAAHHEVDSSTLSKWIARGHLTGAALTPDGRVNVEEAERQLGDRLDLSRSLGKRAASMEPALPLATQAAAPPPAPPLAPALAPAPVAGTLAAIKLEQAQRQLQRDREDDLARRGLYTLTADSDRAHARALAQFIATIEQRAPEMVDLVRQGATDKDGLVAFRRWWRGLRQTEADAASERAAALPEFVVDPAMELSHAA